jgi:hypothetical protein
LLVPDFPTVANVTTDSQVRRVIRPAILERNYVVDLRRYTRNDPRTIGACIRVAHKDRLP